MIQGLADLIVYRLLGLAPGSRLGGALNFFIYDSIKIIVLLALMIFGISLIRSFFPPERTKKILSRYNEYVGNVLAAILGIITPFCSCSSVPIFIGFVESGVPLGVTFSFLISSPLVNEVSAVMLVALFGWKLAGLYVLSGVVIAVIGGILIGRLHLEHLVEEYVYKIKMGEGYIQQLTWRDRAQFAWTNVRDIVRRIWLYVLIGVGVGAAIHGYAPQDLLTRYAGSGSPLAVPVAVAIGIPLYSNAVGTIPIAQALIGKGVGIGTALAFMMAVTALSLPEMIILRKVLKPKLIGIFVGIVGVSIILIGLLFNAVTWAM